ncbi:MAG: hypothetical protein CME10_04420 [Gemmatimonadetes bacterium]|nr:hypothetical protein [Gemmatimonadota bacterium]
MKFITYWLLIISFVGQVYVLHAQENASQRTNTRLYLFDGSIVEGNLIEKSSDLLIIRVENKVFTFEFSEIDKIVTLESLGAGAKTISVKEYPYISFMGGAVAFGLLSWLQFDRAADNESEAELNRTHDMFARAKKLDDKAGRARTYGWASAAISLGSLAVSLRSTKETRRIFPDVGSTANGTPIVGGVYRF